MGKVIHLSEDDIHYLKTIKDGLTIWKARNDNGRFNRAIEIDTRNFKRVIAESTVHYEINN